MLEEEGFVVIRNRAGAVVASPAEKPEDSAISILLDQMRVTLARLQQAGISPEELLVVTRREIQAMGSRRKRKDDE